MGDTVGGNKCEIQQSDMIRVRQRPILDNLNHVNNFEQQFDKQ